MANITVLVTCEHEDADGFTKTNKWLVAVNAENADEASRKVAMWVIENHQEEIGAEGFETTILDKIEKVSIQ